MNRFCIRDIPFEVSMEEAAKALHVFEDDLEDFEEIYAQVVKLISPRLYYGIEKIEENDGKSITLHGIRFESRILAVNVEKCTEVYPYVATSGKAAYDYAQSLEDDLFKFWAHGVCEIALKKTMQAAFEKVKAHLNTSALNAMNPGSLADFPISCQKPLFELLGNVEAETGVTLTPTYLMIPIKSGSGIWYKSDKHYQNCMLCPRVDCRNRRAEYDPDKYESEYAEGRS